MFKMDLNKLDNVILSSKELAYLESEQKRLNDKIKVCHMISQRAIKVRNIIVKFLNNSPELECNKWHKENNVWILNGSWQIKVRKHSDDINFYYELFNNIGIKYQIDKYLSVDSDYDIYDFKYTITISEFEEIEKYFEQINKSEVDIDKLTRSVQKAVKNSDNLTDESNVPNIPSAYVYDNELLQQTDQPKKLVKKKKKGSRSQH